jgi:hypothetical protein
LGQKKGNKKDVFLESLPSLASPTEAELLNRRGAEGHCKKIKKDVSGASPASLFNHDKSQST